MCENNVKLYQKSEASLQNKLSPSFSNHVQKRKETELRPFPAYFSSSDAQKWKQLFQQLRPATKLDRRESYIHGTGTK